MTSFQYDGDRLRAIASEPPPIHECPKCGEKKYVNSIETYHVETDTATNHLECQNCYCEWSIPDNVTIKIKKDES